MSAATQQKQIEFSGNFDSNIKLNAFLEPLKNLSSLMGEEGIILNTSSVDKNIAIYAQNTANGILSHIKYKSDLFDGFKIETDEKIGVLKVGEFVKYFSVLDDDNVKIAFTDNTFSISHDLGNLSFRTADASMITEAPKTFKGAGWFVETEIDQKKFSKLKKAMSVLSNEDSIFVSGVQSTNKVTFTVRSSNVELNTYKLVIDAPVAQDFETAYRKDIWQLILSSNNNIKASFGQKLVKFDIKTEYSDVIYFVAKKSA
jgi:hypothetical protein